MVESIIAPQAQISAIAQGWEAQSAELGRIGELVRQMRFSGDTNLFPRSLVKYSALVSTMDATCQEGEGITAAIGATLRVVILVYRKADAEAVTAARKLQLQVYALRWLP
jgi:hypothetical protein